MMKLLGHRGHWNNIRRKNSLEAVESALLNYDGVEIDVRDRGGEIVVSHDIPNHEALPLNHFLALPESQNKIWAINIKSDGISDCLYKIFKDKKIKNYFCFDMSVPEIFNYKRNKLNIFVGVNDYIKESSLSSIGSGIWLDSFDKLWYSANDLKSFTRIYRKVCIVSEELHGRNMQHQWKMIKDTKIHLLDDVYLCTDKLSEAEEYFYDKSSTV